MYVCTLRCARIGKMKAAVLPEPVGAHASTSRFYRTKGRGTVRNRGKGEGEGRGGSSTALVHRITVVYERWV